jgi:hypothetical protein
MSSSKRARLSLEWFVISARTVRVSLLFLIGGAALGGGCYWLYLHLQSSSEGETPAGRQGARFIQIAGKVKVKRAHATDFNAAREDMALEAGDTIQTQADSVARVQFVDGSSYTIKPDTTLVIKDNALLSDKTTRVQVRVHVGTINLATQEQTSGSSNVVQTSAASARVGSQTEATVATGANGDQADIRVARGNAQVTTQSGQTFVARANERLEFDPQGKLTKRTSLVPTPVLQSPENQQYLRPDAAGVVRVSWAAVAQAKSYQVELATTPSFGETVVASREGVGAPGAGFSNLPVGTYYWRVRANDGKETGAYSDPFKFTLTKQAGSYEVAITRLKHTPLGGNSFVVEGHTEPGARVKVGGVTARVEPDGNFRAFVTLDGKGRELIVEAQDRDGNMGQQRLRF